MQQEAAQLSYKQRAQRILSRSCTEPMGCKLIKLRNGLLFSLFIFYFYFYLFLLAFQPMMLYISNSTLLYTLNNWCHSFISSLNNEKKESKVRFCTPGAILPSDFVHLHFNQKAKAICFLHLKLLLFFKSMWSRAFICENKFMYNYLYTF